MMARHATIIGQVSDLSGDMWDVRESRPTAHGFDVVLGWPASTSRGRGGGGPRVVVTEELAAYLEAHKCHPSGIELPIGRSAIKRVRKLLGHDWRVDRMEWWLERLDDLAELTLEAFAARHNVTASATEANRLRLMGKLLRCAGWWDDATIIDYCVARSDREIAEKYDISLGAARKVRARCAVALASGEYGRWWKNSSVRDAISGMSGPEIAKKYGVSLGHAATIRRDIDGEFAPWWDSQDVRADFAAMRTKDLAIKYGKSQAHISMIRRRMSEPRRVGKRGPNKKRPPWWDTPEIRADFATIPPTELAEKYQRSLAQIYNIRTAMGVDTLAVPRKQRGRPCATNAR